MTNTENERINCQLCCRMLFIPIITGFVYLSTGGNILLSIIMCVFLSQRNCIPIVLHCCFQADSRSDPPRQSNRLQREPELRNNQTEIQDPEERRRLFILESVVQKKVILSTNQNDDTDDDDKNNDTNDDGLISEHETELSSRQSDNNSFQNSMLENILNRKGDIEIRPPRQEEEGYTLESELSEREGESSTNHQEHNHHGDIENNLPSTRTEATNSNRSCSPLSCHICLERYKIGEDICWSKNTECPHAYHLDCMVQWLMDNDDCPLCREEYLCHS